MLLFSEFWPERALTVKQIHLEQHGFRFQDETEFSCHQDDEGCFFNPFWLHRTQTLLHIFTSRSFEAAGFCERKKLSDGGGAVISRDSTLLIICSLRLSGGVDVEAFTPSGCNEVKVMFLIHCNSSNNCWHAVNKFHFKFALSETPTPSHPDDSSGQLRV